MTIIMFTLVSPYDQVGQLHNGGLDMIGSNLPGSSLDYCIAAPQFAAQFITSNYYPAENAMDQAALEAIYYYALLGGASVARANAGMQVLTDNRKVDISHSFVDIYAGDGFNSYIMEPFIVLDNFVNWCGLPPCPTTPYSIIFSSDIPATYQGNANAGSGLPNLTYASLFQKAIDQIYVEIAMSNMGGIGSETALPYIAQIVMYYSYQYWYNVYNNGPNWTMSGSNVWYAYLVSLGNTAPFDTNVDWFWVIRSDIRGAVAGAMAGKTNDKNNVITGTILGAAAASMTASAIGASLGQIDPYDTLGWSGTEAAGGGSSSGRVASSGVHAIRANRRKVSAVNVAPAKKVAAKKAAPKKAAPKKSARRR